MNLHVVSRNQQQQTDDDKKLMVYEKKVNAFLVYQLIDVYVTFHEIK